MRALQLERADPPAESIDLYDATFGPIVIYPRKKNYKRSEILEIWETTGGTCHLCGRKWKLSERSRLGWHVDHVIPHIGGGPETEQLSNLRVACAKCNLDKGRGYKEEHLQSSIQKLVLQLPQWKALMTSTTVKH